MAGFPIAKGKGKGKPGPPPGPPALATAKAKGKGKEMYNTVPVPADLRAPGHQRLQMPDLRPYGDIWDSLDPWDCHRADVLQETTIDFDSLFEQWAPMPAPVAPPQVVTNRLLLDSKTMGNLDVSIRGTGLTPEKIHRGLFENFDLLLPDQAQVLHQTVAPVLDEVRGLLQTIVQNQGIADLSRVESVLWALESVPNGSLLLRFAHSHSTFHESVSFACTPMQTLRELRDELETSKPLRTVLQACLISCNVLSQKGNVRLTPQMLTTLSTRKLQANAPSILTHVARDMQRTHEARCRLRFLRVFAVGQAPLPNHVKKSVWKYLDDLTSSPWDVLGTLNKCRSWDLEAREEVLRFEKSSCVKLSQAFQLLDGEILSADSCIGQQLRSLQTSNNEALSQITECLSNLPEIAQALLRFFGHEKRDPRGLESASELLDILAYFGSQLRQAQQSIAIASLRCMNGNSQHGPKWGTWELVDTSEVCLRFTTDPELIRSLKNIQADVGKQDKSVEAAEDEKPKTEQNRLCPKPKHIHLLHGGADGEYRRCELTGKWVPMGLAATLMERDRGARGATSGFFVTY